MQYEINPNGKHESDKRITFMEQIRAWDPDKFTIVVKSADLIDPEGPVALSNLPLTSYHLKLVDAVRFEYTDGNVKQLHPVPPEV